MPPDSPLTFPPPGERRPYTLEIADAWAAVLDLSEWAAFMAFGPCGRGEGNSEPAGAWQTLLRLLRDAAAGKGLDGLGKAVRDHIQAGDLYIDPDTLQIRAKTIGALFTSTALADLKQGRKLGRCETCNRNMVLVTATQRYCSNSCRVRGSQARSKQKSKQKESA